MNVSFWHSTRGTSNDARVDDIMHAAAATARRAGHTVTVNTPGDAALNVTWTNLQAERVGNDAPTCILEGGYTHSGCATYREQRLQNTSISWNDSHGRSTWAPKYCPSDRWDMLGIELQPWRVGGYDAVILGQKNGDYVLPKNYLDRLPEWVRSASVAHDSARLRQHPIVQQYTGPVKPLADDLAGAKCAITWNSTASVETVIAGIPTVCLDRYAITWPVTSHSIVAPLYRGEREQWAYDLAYRQYTLSELRDGTAWEYIERGYAQTIQTVL